MHKHIGDGKWKHLPDLFRKICSEQKKTNIIIITLPMPAKLLGLVTYWEANYASRWPTKSIWLQFFLSVFFHLSFSFPSPHFYPPCFFFWLGVKFLFFVCFAYRTWWEFDISWRMEETHCWGLRREMALCTEVCPTRAGAGPPDKLPSSSKAAESLDIQ